jgi:hypothetical protein
MVTSSPWCSQDLMEVNGSKEKTGTCSSEYIPLRGQAGRSTSRGDSYETRSSFKSGNNPLDAVL